MRLFDSNDQNVYSKELKLFVRRAEKSRFVLFERVQLFFETFDFVLQQMPLVIVGRFFHSIDSFDLVLVPPWTFR